MTDYKWRLYIEGTLINCTCNFNDGEIITGDLIIRANSGYKFNKAHTYTINWETEHLHLLEDDTVLKLDIRDVTANVYLEDEYKGVPIGGVEPEPEPTRYNVHITGSFINCTCNFNDGEIITGDLIIRANSGYKFNKAHTYTINWETEHLHLLEDDTVLKLNIEDVTADIYLEDEYKGVPIGGVEPEPEPEPEYMVTITGTLINCTCNFNSGDVVDKAIEITANDGYTFKGLFTYTINYGTEHFSIYNNGKTLRIPLTDVTANVYLDDEYKATEQVNKISGMANLYMVSDDELVQLSKNRIVIIDNTNVDYGSYITNLYILPFKLPDNLIGTRDSIILGNHDTNVETTLINDYMFTFNGGTIQVPNKYSNIYDYVNTECILHLPFLDNVYLPTEYVINQSISVSFIIELYSGTITMNVTSTFNNEIIATRKGIIGISIPFIQKTTGTISNIMSDVYSNLIDRCFIEVKRNIPYTRNTDLFGSTVIEFGTISDYEGFIQCEDVQLITDATNQEQTEIINLLNKGVYI